MFVDIIHNIELIGLERVQGAQRARLRMVHDTRARAERECGREELQRASHKYPKGSSKCACIVHLRAVWTSRRVYSETKGRGGKNV